MTDLSKRDQPQSRSRREAPTETVEESNGRILTPYSPAGGVPVILLAHSRAAIGGDRFPIGHGISVGRSVHNEIVLRDGRLSAAHFRIVLVDDQFWLEDAGSTNGTYLNGGRVEQSVQLADRDVIRAGRSLFVFLRDGHRVLDTAAMDLGGLIGSFHTAPLIEELTASLASSRHTLLAGPSGSGKELLAQAASVLTGRPLVAHNCARYTSEEEATSTLFGVAPRVFSSVDARAGVLEKAHGGIAFLDEVHNLPERVQRSLLRIIEDGAFARIGESKMRPLDTVFILASNAPGPEHALAADLLARLYKVSVPSLAERRADLPAIFDGTLDRVARKQGLDPQAILDALHVTHYERMCLYSFPRKNVRGLIDVVERIVLRCGQVEPGEYSDVVDRVVLDLVPAAVEGEDGARISTPPPSLMPEPFAADVPVQDGRARKWFDYERYKNVIIETYEECGGNVSAVERTLKAKGYHCNHRFLTKYLKEWGVR